MQEWIRQIFESGGFTVLMFPAAFVLGLVTALGSGCNVAALAAVAGYAARMREKATVSSIYFSLGFVVSTVGTLALSGAVLGSVGAIGRFGRLAAGLLMIVLGLVTLNLVPFRIPKPKFLEGKAPESAAGGLVFGVTLGAASASCSLFCHAPLLMLMLGAAAAQANPALAAANMALFAVGFCVPMLAIMLGIGMGKASAFGASLTKPLTYFGAGLLLIVGFYFLWTL